MTHRLMQLILFFAGYAFSFSAEDEDYWPHHIFTQDSTAENWHEPDTSGISATSRTTLYHTFTTQNEVTYAKRIGNTWLRQNAEYQFTQDNPQSSVHFVDASGDLLYRNTTFLGLHPGISWSPVISYSKWIAGALQSNFEIGPKLEGTIAGLPCHFATGLYNYIWNDSITPWLLSTTDDRYHITPGVSGSFQIGNGRAQYRNLPLYVTLNGWGRAAGGNNLGQFGGSALYMSKLRQFGGDDSLYLHVGDSLTNGKKLYIGETGGNTFVSNTSWRTDHSFSAAAGVKFAQRLSLVPKVYYRYSLHSIAYPAQDASLSDIRTTGHAAGLQLNLLKNRWIEYSGNIEVAGHYEDCLFKRSFGENEVPLPGERELYIVNQTDHATDLAKTDHDLCIRLPANFFVQYHFAASKDSKKYPFVYLDNVTSVKKNENENDRVQQDHMLSAGVNDSLYHVELYGKYGVMQHYFYHENRSAESRTSNEYRTGFRAEFDNGRLALSEHVYLDAEVSDYYFKKVGDFYNAAPPYSRNFSSTLTGSLQVSDFIAIKGNWVLMVNDNGYWYGNDYRPDSLQFTHEYYGIERKGTQYWLDFSADYMFDRGKLTAGSRLRDVFERRFNFDEQRYIISDLDVGYGIEPYILAECVAGGTFYKLRVKRIFNTGDTNRWKPKKNWDIALVMKMAF